MFCIIRLLLIHIYFVYLHKLMFDYDYINLSLTKTMLMKQLALLVGLTMTTCLLSAQDYNVTFSAYAIDTPTDQVDSVQVENITQDKTITVSGDDTLHLVDVVQNIEQAEKKGQFSVYPNPASEYAFVEFWSYNAGDAKIAVYDIAGRQILTQPIALKQGLNTYKLAGLSQGNYVVSMGNDEMKTSETLNATGNTGTSLSVETVQNPVTSETLQRKSTKAGTVVDWQYDEDDILIFNIQSLGRRILQDICI